MNFDLRPHYPQLAGDGQTLNSGSHPGGDQYENCTFEALRQTLRAYGYSPGLDDEQMREMADPGSHGGEPWSTTQALSRRLAPDLPVDVEWPGDIAAAIRGYGAQGFVVHWAAWCDTQAWVPAQGQVVASHAEMALWADDGGIGSRNPWPHPNWHGSDDEIRQLYDGGGILVFKRSLIPAPKSPEDDMPQQTAIPVYPQVITAGQKAYVLVAVNCDKDNAFLEAIGIDEGDSTVNLLWTDPDNNGAQDPSACADDVRVPQTGKAEQSCTAGVRRGVIECTAGTVAVGCKLEKKS
jgi:hypothetical protein